MTRVYESGFGKYSGAIGNESATWESESGMEYGYGPSGPKLVGLPRRRRREYGNDDDGAGATSLLPHQHFSHGCSAYFVYQHASSPLQRTRFGVE